MSNTSLLGSYGGLGESSLMFRNRIINGSMAIDQRNAGVAVTVTANASAVHTLDRWRVFSAGSNATVARVAGSGSNQYALRITGAVSNTGTVLEQRIEASNCYDLVNNAVTVSFQVSSTSITTLNWSADYPTGGVDNWSGATAIASGSVTINSTNNTYSFTFNAGANVVNGLRITFTSGALLGSQTITYQQVQLEAGPTATPFERRPIGVELGMAMRYCYVPTFPSNSTRLAFGAAVGATVTATIPLPVTMRDVAVLSVITLGSLAASDGSVATALTSASNFSIVASQNAAGITANTASALTSFRPYWIERSGGVAPVIVISAEL
jgi:hypothetical protein